MNGIKGSILGRKAKGTFTVEAAVVVPMVLFCTFWILEKGIALYTDTVEISSVQESWEAFCPAEEFRKLKLLTELI